MGMDFPVTVEKLSGLGNDFLLIENPPSGVGDWPATARRLCDRTSGIGADGLLLLGNSGGESLTMKLYNSDGSVAEMSGNGIRCLVQAAYRSSGRTSSVVYQIATDAGTRRVEVTPRSGTVVDASVDMGEISSIEAPSAWSTLGADPNRPVMHLSVGNPHAVVGVEDVAVVPLKELGERVPMVNLEIIEPGPESNAITMRVHERGAGITMACGTGACASAWAAVQWGLVSAKANDVIVHMDGGDVRVRVNEPAPGRVTLIGPSEHLLTTTAVLHA